MATLHDERLRTPISLDRTTHRIFSASLLAVGRGLGIGDVEKISNERVVRINLGTPASSWSHGKDLWVLPLPGPSVNVEGRDRVFDRWVVLKWTRLLRK